MIILASQSPTRQALLTLAGVTFTVRPPHFDERQGMENFKPTDKTCLALHLALEKARGLTPDYPESVVIGADQTLHCNGELFRKPLTRDAARAQLLRLRGKTHCLTSAVACFLDSAPIWHHVAEAEITMRDFSDVALENYLDTAGEAVLGAVGSYHYEGNGIQLMETVRGDYHTILGFPVLPLLAYLRSQGHIPT
ncbi:MAG: Maf-like protein [Phyllobacteriaceae bacterium]|nr:Maf-like protein [Phyllobacteriaceae bacterium]